MICSQLGSAVKHLVTSLEKIRDEEASLSEVTYILASYLSVDSYLRTQCKLLTFASLFLSCRPTICPVSGCRFSFIWSLGKSGAIYFITVVLSLQGAPSLVRTITRQLYPPRTTKHTVKKSSAFSLCHSVECPLVGSPCSNVVVCTLCRMLEYIYLQLSLYTLDSVA